MIWFGAEGNILLMDLLGPGLDYLFNFCSRKLSLKTVLMLANQLISQLQILFFIPLIVLALNIHDVGSWYSFQINHIEVIHSKSFKHRHIKPHHFLMGLGWHANQIADVDRTFLLPIWSLSYDNLVISSLLSSVSCGFTSMNLVRSKIVKVFIYVSDINTRLPLVCAPCLN